MLPTERTRGRYSLKRSLRDAAGFEVKGLICSQIRFLSYCLYDFKSDLIEDLIGGLQAFPARRKGVGNIEQIEHTRYGMINHLVD